jgi:hypothetical protein
MSEIRKRLEAGVAMLGELERRRQDTETPKWGLDKEFDVVMRELCELEMDILQDPGALSGHLVRARRKGRRHRDNENQ